jgi:hypothetical protein
VTDRHDTPPGGSFLARRARLKAERQRASAEPPAESASPPEPAGEPAPKPPQLTDADMPPVESLTADSDFSQFLAEGVSDGLRRAALRKMFHLPEFNILDGLNDYDEDYTKFEKLGDILTYHQRRMKEREEAARKDAEAREEAQDAATADRPDAGDETGDGTVRRADEKAAEGTLDETSPEDGGELDDDGDLEA